MADDVSLLGSLLGVQRPWGVTEYRISSSQDRIDVWIATWQAKSWFGRGQPTLRAAALSTWRHTNLGSMQCYVHFPTAEQAKVGEAAWAGDSSMPFSRAMTSAILALLGEGLSYEAICSVLSIPFTDLWKYKFALDRGLKGAASGNSGASGSARAAPTERVAGQNGGALPDADDPVWELLLVGGVNIDIQTLSLQLLVTRLRSQMKLINDAEVKIIKIRELQRYFNKHEKQLGHEIGQLNAQLTA